MKRLLLGLPLILVLTGCNQKEGYITTTKQYTDTDKAAKFIVACAEAANPLSDEEGEDLVRECKYTAKELYGTSKFVAKVATSGSIGSEVCSGDTYQEAKECFQEQFPTLKIN